MTPAPLRLSRAAPARSSGDLLAALPAVADPELLGGVPQVTRHPHRRVRA